MIDSHCHLADKQFKKDLDQVLKRATQAGITKLVCIADSLPEAEQGIEIAGKYDQVYCTVGVHPHNARHFEDSDLKRIEGLVTSSQKVKAIGEIGLDYHYDNSPRDVQQQVFKKQLELAKKLNLPIVVHNRESITDLKRIIGEVDPEKLVIHCCTDAWEDVADLVEAGYLLGFTGIATYPKSEVIRETINRCPLEQMMIETDAPYLAPLPHRGKRNEPAYVAEVAKCIAEVKGISVSEVDEITTQNATSFYDL